MEDINISTIFIFFHIEDSEVILDIGCGSGSYH
jgi:hypothetical protein